MKIVGKQLESWAHSQADIINKDLFARSAFNRYYYAAFLVTREMLADIESRWKGVPHANIPEILERSLQKPLVKQLELNVRRNLMAENEKERLKHKFIQATSDLADLLKFAYEARVVADYEPETIIVCSGDVMWLKSFKLNSAERWFDRANSYCKVIRRVWRDAGFA